MNFLSRWFGRGSGDKRKSSRGVEMRPLSGIASIEGRPASIATTMASPEYASVVEYFTDYPERSFMSDHSRAVVYSLVRMLRPKLVAEIGTLHAGTTEVLARALWENGDGVVHTTDPYGEQRCPAIIAKWPKDLQKHVQFHAKSSMDFFARMLLESKTFDLVLIDGNHDYEFALFDLQLAARLIQPNGIVVLDNAEQTGPFKAARQFLEQNPAWTEIGGAIAEYDHGDPFKQHRSSLVETTFLLLQAPGHVAIGQGPHSWGQKWIDNPNLVGFEWSVAAAASGTLHYQVYLRGFANGNRWVEEQRQSGRLRIDAPSIGAKIRQEFDSAMSMVAPHEFNDALFTYELNLSWEADPGTGHLPLRNMPDPLN